jgi:hypothetical protein
MEHRRQMTLSLPELALIGGTRAILGAGLALLHGDRISPEQRKAVGWAFTIIGIVATIPLGIEILGGRRLTTSEERAELEAA